MLCLVLPGFILFGPSLIYIFVLRSIPDDFYEAAELESWTVHLDVAGTSSALVRASERLEGRVGGTSTVEYLGDPAVAVEVGDQASVRPAGT